MIHLHLNMPTHGDIWSHNCHVIQLSMNCSKTKLMYDINTMYTLCIPQWKYKWLLWILKVKHDFDLWPSHTWTWLWIFMVKFWNSCNSEWEGRLTLHKGGGSRSFMTMTMTIWWPRSGVWIYQKVTRVTSVFGVPSTHQVCYFLLQKNAFR